MRKTGLLKQHGRMLLVLASLCICIMGAANDCDKDGDGHSAISKGGDDCVDNPATDPTNVTCSSCDCGSTPGCSGCAKCISPDREEIPGDLADNNCDGFDDEKPAGFTRTGSSGQGQAIAVAWHRDAVLGDHVYVAAGAVLQVYDVPPGSAPGTAIHEIDLKDIPREITVDGNTLFVAGMGDGLIAYDLTDPARPVERDRVSGQRLIDGRTVDVLVMGVDAGGGKVAAALFNYSAKGNGEDASSFDVWVYEYDPITGFDENEANVVRITRSVRRRSEAETPISLGLTESGGQHGIYVGYAAIDWEWIAIPEASGEVVYIPDLGSPEQAVWLSDRSDAVLDIETDGLDAYVGTAVKSDPLQDPSPPMLRRVRYQGGGLTVTNLLLAENAMSPGGMLDIRTVPDGQGNTTKRLCFGNYSVGRYLAANEELPYRFRDYNQQGDPEQVTNLWLFGWQNDASPELLATASTMDWIMGVTCRLTAGSAWMYVVDEWGGLEVIEYDGTDLRIPDPGNRMRAATGQFSTGMWAHQDPSGLRRVYSVKEGAGLWAVDIDAGGQPVNERVVVEWIDPDSGGCDCSGCSCPTTRVLPYGPAVFVDAGGTYRDSSGLRLFLTANERNIPIGGQMYLMEFLDDGVEEATLTRSVEIGRRHGALVKAEGGLMVVAAGDGLPQTHFELDLYSLASSPAAHFRTIEQARAYSPAESGLTDAAAYGDYLLVIESRTLLFSPAPSEGRIHVFKWKSNGVPIAPPGAISYLGAFCTTRNPTRLLVSGDRLIVGTGPKSGSDKHLSWLVYPLNRLNQNPPAAPADSDAGLVYLLPGRPSTDYETLATVPTSPFVTGAALVTDSASGTAGSLYLADASNGLCKYAFESLSNPKAIGASLVGIYPAHPTSMSSFFTPKRVRTPDDHIPLLKTSGVAAVTIGSGERRIVVQELTSGRVAILGEP